MTKRIADKSHFEEFKIYKNHQGIAHQIKRCQAFKKRSDLQCNAPAANGRGKCTVHGGIVGKRTPQGEANRIASLSTKGGTDTVAIREARAAKTNTHRTLVKMAVALGLQPNENRMSPKPLLSDLPALISKLVELEKKELR